jgi:hypothetical protein
MWPDRRRIGFLQRTGPAQAQCQMVRTAERICSLKRLPGLAPTSSLVQSDDDLFEAIEL